MTQTLSMKDPTNIYHAQSYNSFDTFNYKNKRESVISSNDSNEFVSSANAFEKLAYNLKNNSIYTKEIVLGKLIGFYRLGDEIGTGNFSKVKRGVHLLTKGIKFVCYNS